MEAFVTNAVSFRIIEDRSFRKIFTNFSEPVVLMNRKSLSERILSDYTKYNDFMKTKLADVKYICTTADIWSSKTRSFLGVTAHYFTEDLKRESLALACRRFAGPHTYENIAALLSKVHAQFNVLDKVVATVTDNASNFKKAFQEFGIDKFYQSAESSARINRV